MNATHTVGVVFNKDKTKVLLMLKNRPDWQKGKHNGPGGKIEDYEDSASCVVREVEEETNLLIQKEKWAHSLNVLANGISIDIYGTIYYGKESDAKALTDEKIKWISVNNLPENMIPNLRYIIPATLNKLSGDEFTPFVVEYK